MDMEMIRQARTQSLVTSSHESLTHLAERSQLRLESTADSRHQFANPIFASATNRDNNAIALTQVDFFTCDSRLATCLSRQLACASVTLSTSSRPEDTEAWASTRVTTSLMPLSAATANKTMAGTRRGFEHLKHCMQ